ncbi:DUF58 domain-containing protein [Arachnia propionica]|uniref:DUF58 domain-containing protein n=1 Tax=Arachnia propionica TaxID=1750 RepID=A0A3P1T6Y6_9ACTN|nr:DUF58 domain-containing protein [Arachnia propionica]MDO5083514.1 DUF58 domain-containing protein [Arachnia propionica]RRD04935.1 DUF58 domain-containing protein [Arachnia propionica]
MRFRSGLTARGWTLLIAGGAITIATSWIGEPDLAWVGLFLAAIPCLGLLVVLFLSPRLAVERSVVPPSVSIGEHARARLLVSNSRHLGFSSLSFEDHTPDSLGPHASFDLARGLTVWRQAAGYEVPTSMRGHFPLGPLSAKNFDPFATAWKRWRVPGEPAWLRVTPEIWHLPLPRSGRSVGTTGEATPQRVGQAGTDDVLVREYRHGDGLRRVHWRMTAKRGEMMVRLEEQPWDPAMTVLVDTRAQAHLGTGRNSTLEWGISFGTSLATALLQERLRIAVVGANGVVFQPLRGEGSSSSERLIAAMTEIQASGRESLEDCLADPDALSAARSLVACLGVLTARDAASLVAATAGLAQTDALVPDAVAFDLPPERARAHEEACRLLSSTGWNLASYAPGTSVPEGWQLLMARREAL